MAVLLLAVIYVLSQLGLQGAISPGKLATAGNNGVALTAVAQALGGSGWAKVMALALALSVIATTGAGIVLTARLVYGMASYRTLPTFLANVSRRFSTPVAASVIVGFLIVGLAWVYLLTTSVQGAFNDVVAVTGLLFAVFYVLTALATMTYYRRRILRTAWDALTLGVLPLGAAGFLVWMVEQYLQTVATASQDWSLIGVVALGLILLFVARFVLRSEFFALPRESYRSDADTAD